MRALLFDIRDDIAYLTLNRPQVHNAINPELMVQLAEAWKRVAVDDAVRVIIITGAGDKAFSAGADLARLLPLTTRDRPPEDEWDHKLLQNPELRSVAMLHPFPMHKPIIAAINGYCIAGGMELMLATDIRVAAEHATFGLMEVKWSLIPYAGSLVRTPRQIPYCNAMELLLTGDLIDAPEARRLGLINHVVPRAQLMAKAEEIARKIAANGPLAVRAIKQGVTRTSGRPLEEGYEIENELARGVFSSEDAKEGPRAFIEKRKPIFKGK
ncbi:MAG: enoyl-CoA hydratase/isomerase family protein [Candidatus Binataceae bacterium]|nr:enoyl-CoA hydratase/isomerase family protein [Candidatus Binataceae bacterium]